MERDIHIFQGLSRTTHPIKQEGKFLWDAHNIRLTTRNEETLLSITNEKSTRYIKNFDNFEEYVGHIVAGDYLILFTHHPTYDTIYRWSPNEESGIDILYRGNLSLDPNNPIQAVYSYETELIQKVYWVDGINRPRMINIMKPELLEKSGSPTRDYTELYNDAPFNFVQDLKLEEEVSVSGSYSNVGVFPAGVIQYAFTYGYKYGQETNIFYTTELLYITFPDRGGSPEDKISISFNIDINNIDTKFDYVRVYSILRTSIDATPTVKRVTDYDINGNTSITIVDNNTTGDTVDPYYLLYLGGKDIVPKCIASKDNTLFLGDITYKRLDIKRLEIRKEVGQREGGYKKLANNRDFSIIPRNELFPQYIDGSSNLKDTITDKRVNIEELEAGNLSHTISPFYRRLFNDYYTKNTATFKNGETYRLGCRFQYKTGEWSEPVWVDDYLYEDNSEKVVFNSLYTFKKIHLKLDDELINKLQSSGYKRVQPLIVRPENKDRTILAQGILTPTVGQVGNRVKNVGAYVQSSWLLRPFTSTEHLDLSFPIPAFHHNMSLYMGCGRNVEIQTMSYDLPYNTQLSYSELIEGKDKYKDAYYGSFVVDQSILTMYSPDIEFGNIKNIALANTELDIQKVGYVTFGNNLGDISLQTSTPTINPDARGVIKEGFTGVPESSLITLPCFEDSLITKTEDSGKVVKEDKTRLWAVYMWHKSGSLNNDINRNDSIRSAQLKEKRIVNIKSVGTSIYKAGKSIKPKDIKFFNSNEVVLTKLKLANGKIVNYYGNIDTLLTSSIPYNSACTHNTLVYFAQSNISGVYQDIINFSGTLTHNENDAKIKINGNIYTCIIYKIGENAYLVTSGNREGTLANINVLEYNGEKIANNNIGKYCSIILYCDGAGDQAKIKLVLSRDVKLTLKEDPTSGRLLFRGNVYESNYTYSDIAESIEKVINGTSDELPTVNSPLVNLKSLTEGIGEGILNPEDNPKIDSQFYNFKEGVRMRYKTTPHIVTSIDEPLDYNKDNGTHLILADLKQNVGELRYGGNTEEALMSNIWIPAGKSIKLSEKKIEWVWGDTWINEFECLKTYPYSFDDKNQVTEIGAFYCESRVNMNGRYNRNKGNLSFSLSPTNFNLINPVYSQLDTFFTSRILDEDYYKVSNKASQFTWSQTKLPASETDIWTNLNLASSQDMDGSYGKLTSIVPFNELLLGFQDNAVNHILFNSRVQIQASDGVPIEIANSSKVEGTRLISNSIGCQDKFSTCVTPMGVYFIDNNNCTIYKFDGNMNNLGLKLGSLYWLRDVLPNNTWKYKSDKSGNAGIRIDYDPKFQDVYFIPGIKKDNTIDEALCFSEQLDTFTSLMSYGGSIMFPINSRFYSLTNDNIPYELPDGTMDEAGKLAIFENFTGDGYNNIFNKVRPFEFSFISNIGSITPKIFNTIEFRTDLYSDTVGAIEPNLIEDNPIYEGFNYTIQSGKPINYIRVTNEYQDTGIVNLDDKNFRKKFRIWRVLVPRNKGSRDRILNPWCKITLGNNKPHNNLTILHDLEVKFTM